jgi:predicted NAD/FAD-binding protein
MNELHGASWELDGEAYDAVVLAASAAESARLAAAASPRWAAQATALQHDPIVTVYLRSPGTQLPSPMMALRSGAREPAQFVFDRGVLGGPSGLLAFVISGAEAWVAAGRTSTLEAVRAQATASLGALLQSPLETIGVVSEKRATFQCTPALQRPSMEIAPGLLAAGDYVEGPYPATLEGAVRSGLAAARAC